MKKLIFVLMIALMLTFMLTLTASATQPTHIQGFFLPAASPYDFCFGTGVNNVLDDFLYGCGYYVIDLEVKPGQGGHTAIWDGTIDGKSGTCIIHVMYKPNEFSSKVTMNQCTGGLAGYHSIADGDFINFTWEGTYHWEIKD